ncbi:MAG: hypothetical protein ACXV6K_05815, partial [Halobacteriota archaeon]
TVVLDAPLASILLAVTIATTSTIELGYIALATATALILGVAIKKRMKQRAARQGGAAEPSSAEDVRSTESQRAQEEHD